MKKIDNLRERSLCVGMSDEQLEAFSKACVEEEYADGDFIVRENELGTDLFILREGMVGITKNGMGDEHNVLSGSEKLEALREGDFFGEMTMIDFQPRSANVIALENVKLFRLNIKTFNEVLKNDPDMRLLLFMNIARVLSRRLRGSNLKALDRKK